MSKNNQEAVTKQKFKKIGKFQKFMQNMEYLSKHCNINAVYPFLNLCKALESFTSKRLVKLVEIFSFFKNLL
jgi:hypothetical protein